MTVITVRHNWMLYLWTYDDMMTKSGKKKTSIYIDQELWNEWMHFVIDDPRYGSSRKASEALEDAMRCYLEEKAKKKSNA